MSDYLPDPNRYDPNKGYDKYGNARFDSMVDNSGRGPYVLLALLAIVGLIGGAMYFNGAPKDPNANTANAPGATSAPITTPMERAKPRQLPAVPADQALPKEKE